MAQIARRNLPEPNRSPRVCRRNCTRCRSWRRSWAARWPTTPPLALKEGGIFRDGFDPHLDELRQASRDGKTWITQLQEREIASTGIKSLKVRFNSVFGYFIEITKSNLASAPAHYTRKQTTVGGERFITPELKEMEAKILGADERARHLEYQLFQTLREETLGELAPIQQTANAIATLDAICSLAETARLFHYCRPELDTSLRLCLKDARHPVLDQNLAEEKFVPNDTDLDGETLAAGDYHRAKHGRKINLHPPGRADRPAGADRQLRPGSQRTDRPGRSHLHPGRGE